MKQRVYKKYLPPCIARCVAVVMCFFLFLLFVPDVSPQDFSSLDNDLAFLETLISDTLANTEEQQKLLDSLRTNLNESGTLIASYESIISGQENLLRELQTQLNAMSETYRMQSSLSARYAKSSRFWRTFTLIAVPVTAVISGGIVYAVTK